MSVDKTILCPNCEAEINYVEVRSERQGVMDFGQLIEFNNDGDIRYFCPECDIEIEESTLESEGVIQRSE